MESELFHVTDINEQVLLDIQSKSEEILAEIGSVSLFVVSDRHPGN
jgi:hypothetical protein